MEYYNNKSKRPGDYYTDEKIAEIKERQILYRESHEEKFITLWEYLTRKKSAPGNVVELKFTSKRKLEATLWEEDAKLDSRTIRFKQNKDWNTLSGQDVATPLLWYFIWGWQKNETAIGINTTGNLCVHYIQGGILMIGIIPTIGGGGGPGGVSMFERAE